MCFFCVFIEHQSGPAPHVLSAKNKCAIFFCLFEKGKWDYCGERALLLKEKRSATVVAGEKVTEENVYLFFGKVRGEGGKILPLRTE